MPALDFARETFFDPRSPACIYRHPWQALRVGGGAVRNLALPLVEAILRRKDRECPVCGWQGADFRTFLSADEVIPACICPGCGSFDRHRQLVLGVRDELARRPGWNPDIMLGFSLSSALRFLLEHEGLARCFRSDVDADDRRFSPDLVADLRSCPVADASVDWVFCSHVLEHIAELDICIDELVRVLKPGGAAWLQVPFEPGLAHSKRIPIDPHRAHAHAWQFAPDFGTLIKRPEWEVQEVQASDAVSPGERRRFGIDPEERFWLARKHD